MGDENVLSKIKDFISKYILFILIGLIIIILLLLLWPSKSTNNPNKNSSVLTLTLKGNTNVSILKGDNYSEAGYVAYDTIEGDLTYRVTVVGQVNTNVVGTYIIKYSVTNSSQKRSEAVRTVKVIENLTDLDIKIDYYPKELTNKNVSINLKISGDNYEFAVDPKGTVSKLKELNYTVSENDDYIFWIKRKDSTAIEKHVEIKNIDKVKPTGSCKATLSDKLDITVTANDDSGISKYEYNINNNKYESTKNTYSIKSTSENVSVTIYDKAMNSETITCLANKISNVGEWPEFVTPNYLKASTPKHFLENMVFSNKVRYLLYYPDNLDLSKKNPLVVYIHGAGDCGANTNKMYRENGKFINHMRNGEFKDAVYLAPQCNCIDGDFYPCEKDFRSLIDKIVTEYNINPNKISLTGISSGGSSAQRLISKNPGFFSGAALLAPGLTTGNASTYMGLKIAVFIGTLDALHNGGKTSAETLKSHGVDIKFYSIQGVGHVVESSVYDATNVIDWLIAQEKK